MILINKKTPIKVNYDEYLLTLAIVSGLISSSPALRLLLLARGTGNLLGFTKGVSMGRRGSMNVVLREVWSMKNCCKKYQ